MAEYVNILSPAKDWGEMSEAERAAERESIHRGVLTEAHPTMTTT